LLEVSRILVRSFPSNDVTVNVESVIGVLLMDVGALKVIFVGKCTVDSLWFPAVSTARTTIMCGDSSGSKTSVCGFVAGSIVVKMPVPAPPSTA